MSITRLYPNTELVGFGNEFGRLFEQLLGPARGREAETTNGTQGHGRDLANATSANAWSPALNIRETEKSIVVEVEVPGLAAEDIDISVEDEVLTIRGQKRREETTDGDDYVRVERRYGSFTRRFALPCAVDADAAEARLEHGVLYLELEKVQAPGAKKIGVRAA